jgi:hypothetical protein
MCVDGTPDLSPWLGNGRGGSTNLRHPCEAGRKGALAWRADTAGKKGDEIGDEMVMCLL